MYKKNFFAPIKGWKYLFKKPVTIPMKDIFENPKVAPDNARGFHVNDWEKCIGCGTCSEICPTKAIKMVERAELEDVDGSKPERPTIDYGRCCFCALCVDVCTTCSMNLTKEYLHNSPDPEDFYHMPTNIGIGGKVHDIGYAKTESSDLLDLERVDMELVDADTRKRSFIEILKGYSKEQAKKEAARCVACGICTKTCPAHMNIPEYIEAIWKDDFEEATKQIYKTNPLPGVCGSICTHKCEGVCALTQRGEAIAIRWLKRYIVDNAPEEIYDRVVMSEVSKPVDAKVAVVGSGPSGLSCSYYLKTLGYEVDVYEEKPLAGGVIRYGAPNYRLPDERIGRDIGMLEKIGVNFHTNTKVGRDVTLDTLHEKYDAVFLGTGFFESRGLNIPGTDHEDIDFAMKFLAATRDYRRGTGEIPKVHDSAVVIGGGNVAFDVARTLVRLQEEIYGKSNVSMIALETRDILPADLEESEEGEEEGIHYNFGFGPREVVIENGKIKGVKAVKCLSVFDENKRFSPTFDEEVQQVVEGTQVYIAIGQMPDYMYLSEDMQGKMTINRGKIQAEENGQIKEYPWLFAGGDIVHGPDIIHGVADGHRAAVGIDQYIMEKKGLRK